MDCDIIKEKVYNCLKDKDLGYDSRYLKLASKRKLEDIKLFKIDRKALEECKYQNLSNCLEKKFDLDQINHRKLYSFYEDQFYKEKEKQDEKIRIANIVKQQQANKNSENN
jgi:hypothetical protein